MSTLYWIDHLFWCLGKLYLALLCFDAKHAAEAFWFIRIHLEYRTMLSGSVKLPFKTQFKSHLTSVFGLLVTIVLILFTINLLSCIF